MFLKKSKWEITHKSDIQPVFNVANSTKVQH